MIWLRFTQVGLYLISTSTQVASPETASTFTEVEFLATFTALEVGGSEYRSKVGVRRSGTSEGRVWVGKMAAAGLLNKSGE